MIVSRPEKGRRIGVEKRNEGISDRKDDKESEITTTENVWEFEGITTASAFALITVA